MNLELAQVIIAACMTHSGSIYVEHVLKAQRECQARLIKCAEKTRQSNPYTPISECLANDDNR